MIEDDRQQFVQMIRDSAGAIAPRGGSLDRIRALRFRQPGFDRESWREIGQLGWIGLRLPEERGGVGLGMVESVALYEELGRGLMPEPLIAGTLAAALLAKAGSDRLADVLTGEAIAAVAWAGGEDAVAFEVSDRERQFVEAADVAEFLLVPQVSGDAVALRMVESAEVAIEPIGLQDGGFAATVCVEPRAGILIADDIGATLDRALDEAALSTAAYLLGVSERAFEMTVGYLGERRQFGQPLGAFQALQHRCADMLIQLALTRASLEGAAVDLDTGVAPDIRAAAVSRAKARAADAAMLVAREAVQMHGAIGYTDEYDVGLYVRKAMTLANRYGSAAAHRRRYVVQAA